MDTAKITGGQIFRTCHAKFPKISPKSAKKLKKSKKRPKWLYPKIKKFALAARLYAGSVGGGVGRPPESSYALENIILNLQTGLQPFGHFVKKWTLFDVNRGFTSLVEHDLSGWVYFLPLSCHAE